jgi:hypothetical protein
MCFGEGWWPEWPQGSGKQEKTLDYTLPPEDRDAILRRRIRLPFMSRSFTPSLQHFQKDVERYLVAKRRTNYNKTKKAQKSLPEKIPEELVTKTRDLLLDSLYRLQRYASELGHEADVGAYLEMIVRVEKRMKA